MSSRRHKAQRKVGREELAPPSVAPVGRRSVLLGLCVLLAAGGALYWSSRPAALPPSAPAAIPFDLPNPPVGDMEQPVREIVAETRLNVLKSPRSADAWGWYAAVLDAHLFYDEAAPCYRRAHELAPQDVRYSYNLALVLESIGAAPDEGLALFQRVAEQQPDFPPVQVRIGHCHSLRGDHAAAAVAYRKALALDPNLVIARRALGQALIQVEDFAAAQTELERVAAAAAQDGPTQAALARIYAQRGDEARALAASERARSLRDVLTLPDKIRFQVTQQGRSSRLLLERLPGRLAEGDYAGAVDDLKLLLRTRARDPKVHDQLADAYQHLGQKGLADQELAEARRLRSTP